MPENNSEINKFLKSSGKWVIGKVDRNDPWVQENIRRCREEQEKIRKQSEIDPESLKRRITI